MKGKSSSFRTENLGETKDRDQCALLVLTQHPSATGVTFQASNKTVLPSLGPKAATDKVDLRLANLTVNFSFFLTSYSSVVFL